ncbi:uncharacterized protein LOC134686697 [Mytilus trossulus]|uniref:uncharacterized protein LOC134686697 n=2 Tax=Mytilus trossulus TaxID=6551 RepID=UPI003004A18E
MIRLVMILMNAVFLCVVTADMDMKFGYHVVEGNARYLENIETNLAENTVKIHTPAHNDVMESYQIQDFRQGMQMKCLPSVEQCRLRDIDRKTAGDAGQVTEGFIHSWNKGDNTINSDNEKVVKEMYYINLDQVVDVKSLEGALKKFYQDFNYPVYKEKKIPDDAEMLNITRSTGYKNKGGRVKRQFTTLNNDCKQQQAKTIFGIDSGRSCNHLKMCETKERRNGRWVLTDCDNVHITSPLVYLCVCCPWVTSIDLNGNECACSRMQDW